MSSEGREKVQVCGKLIFHHFFLLLLFCSSVYKEGQADSLHKSLLVFTCRVYSHVPVSVFYCISSAHERCPTARLKSYLLLLFVLIVSFIPQSLIRGRFNKWTLGQQLCRYHAHTHQLSICVSWMGRLCDSHVLVAKRS